VWISFGLIGTGFLVCWNAMLNTIPFWLYRFNSDSIFFWFTTSYMSSNLIGLAVSLLYDSERVSLATKILTGFVVFIGVIAALPFETNPALGIATVAVLGFADAASQGSAFALASIFHPRYVVAVMTGLGVCGVSVTGVQIIIVAAVPPEDNANQVLSTKIFFSICGVVLVACILSYLFIIQRSPVTKHYLTKNKAARQQYVSGQVAPVRGTSDAPGTPVAKVSLRRVFGKVWREAVEVMLVFWVTLAIFPAISGTIEASGPEGRVPFGLILNMCFMVGDLLGRYAPNRDALIFISRRHLWIPVVLRIGFVALFMLCLGDHRFFKTNLEVYAIMGAFAITSGYCATLAMAYGAEDLDGEQKEAAGSIMVFFMTLGLTLGVWSGVLISFVRTGHIG
jgi:equilibrative nucleoside transporter 1/2/3